MLVVGLTGGIGSGKSAAADLFEAHGAHMIDADVIARDVVKKGSDGFKAVVEAFGPAVLGEDGDIDRPTLAKLVFANDKARRDLEAIVHPLVRQEVNWKVHRLGEGPGVAMLVIPLLVESGHYKVERTVVVDCDEQVAVERVMNSRGWTEYEVRARMATQVSREVRLAHADYVIDNTLSRDALKKQVDRCWQWLIAGVQAS